MNKSESENIIRQAELLGCFIIFSLSLTIILFSIYSMNEVRKQSDFLDQRIIPSKISTI